MYKLGGYKMPIVHVNKWKGISEESVKQIISRITKVFVNMGIPSQAVEVVAHDIMDKKKSNSD
jgi:4-oxalocrotonate tautomerase